MMNKIKIETFNKEVEIQDLGSKVYFTSYKNISLVKRFITNSLNSK